MKHKIYSVGGYGGYLNWLLDMGIERVYDIKEANIVFFAGGSDISPSLYAENLGHSTSPNRSRDVAEVKAFRQSKDKFKIGVCRGLQLLTALSGYKLTQHVNHPWSHSLFTEDGKELITNSLHHQMANLIPSKKTGIVAKYKLIAWSNNISRVHLNGEDKDYNFPSDYKEPEIVAFDNNSWGIQGHPEMMMGTSTYKEIINYCQNSVSQLLNKKLF